MYPQYHYPTEKITSNLSVLPNNESLINFPDCRRKLELAFVVHLLYLLLSADVSLNSLVILMVLSPPLVFPCQLFVGNKLIIFQVICLTECLTF